MRYRTRTTNSFNAAGMIGLLLLLAGPLVSIALAVGITPEMLANAARYTSSRNDLVTQQIGVYAGGIAMLAGLAMVIVGRRQHHETVDDTESDFDAFAQRSMFAGIEAQRQEAERRRAAGQP